MSNQGNTPAGTASPLTPPPRTPVRGTQAPTNANVVAVVPSINCVQIIESNITQTKELTDSNWNAWKGSMKCIFRLYDLSEYVLSKVACPNPTHDPVGTKNWDFNDSYVAMIICENISASQKVYIGQDSKSYEV